MGRFWPENDENRLKWHLLARRAKYTIKMAEMARGPRFLPKMYMGWNKIQYVFCYFCPLTYLNRCQNCQNPLKTGLKWLKMTSKWPNFDPFYAKFMVKLAHFRGKTHHGKSRNLEKTPWIGEMRPKVVELRVFLGKVVKLAIFAILLQNTSLRAINLPFLITKFTTDLMTFPVRWLAVSVAIRDVAW